MSSRFARPPAAGVPTHPVQPPPQAAPAAPQGRFQPPAAPAQPAAARFGWTEPAQPAAARFGGPQRGGGGGAGNRFGGQHMFGGVAPSEGRNPLLPPGDHLIGIVGTGLAEMSNTFKAEVEIVETNNPDQSLIGQEFTVIQALDTKFDTGKKRTVQFCGAAGNLLSDPEACQELAAASIGVVTCFGEQPLAGRMLRVSVTYTQPDKDGKSYPDIRCTPYEGQAPIPVPQ